MTANRAVLDLTVAAGVDVDLLSEAIEALLNTERTSSECASASLVEPGVEQMSAAVRADLDAVDVCHAARTVLTRGSDSTHTVTRPMVEAAIRACQRSNLECGSHAPDRRHCTLCAQGTANAIVVCRKLLSALGAPR
jgi:hypothetical protein